MSIPHFQHHYFWAVCDTIHPSELANKLSQRLACPKLKGNKKVIPHDMTYKENSLFAIDSRLFIASIPFVLHG
jgi:hypothetical protein